MMKRMAAMLLAVVMVLGAMPGLAEGTDITVTLSVSRYGEIVKDKNGTDMAYLPVTLTGRDSYTLDDVIRKAHEVYCEGGIDGYASAYSEQYQDISITKMWGDDSGMFGYQVNGGTESVMGGSHPMEDGDRVDVALYQSAWPDTEAYATFDTVQKELYAGDSIELTLSTSGYDEFWNPVFSPCVGADITQNGEETGVVTDEEGKATLVLEETGTYIISAKKSKTVVSDADPEAAPRVVPAITAPVCLVEVKEHPAIAVIHNIAAEYAQVNLADAADNLSWILADMAVYEELFPESEYALSAERKKEGMKLMVDFLDTATKPGDLAKGIIALRSLGYDARSLDTKNFERIDAVKKLTDLVDARDESVTNMYTLPYVIIALSQGEGIATEEQMDYLVSRAVATKADWQSAEHPEYGYMGTDAMTPMILALAPFYEVNSDVKMVIDETVENLKAEQREDGLINGFEGYEPASTGLAICAFSALGMDANQITNGGKTLMEGLLSTVNENRNGFPNAFATEQGFRGLLAWRLLAEDPGKRIYDFSLFPENKANGSGASNCPVIFEVVPEIATVAIEGKEQISKNCFDLPEGSYSYIVSATGYLPETGTVVISAQEQAEQMFKKLSVNLTKLQGTMSVVPGAGAGGGSVGVGGSSKPGKQDNPTEDEPENPIEDKPESPAEEKPAEMVLSGSTFPDVKEEDWYFTAVKYVYENGLFRGTEVGFEPDGIMSRAMLVTVLYRFADPKEETGENPFWDVPEDQWYTEGVKWAAEQGIVSGVSETVFDPDAGITREQLAVILYRYAKLCGDETKGIDLENYQDGATVSDYAIDAMKYAVAQGIISGKTDTLLAPQDGASRAEVATMLMRFADRVR